MRESDKIYAECLEIINELKKCMIEKGWKGRLMGTCVPYEKQYTKCKLRQLEAKRKENKYIRIKKKAQ